MINNAGDRRSNCFLSRYDSSATQKRKLYIQCTGLEILLQMCLWDKNGLLVKVPLLSKQLLVGINQGDICCHCTFVHKCLNYCCFCRQKVQSLVAWFPPVHHKNSSYASLKVYRKVIMLPVINGLRLDTLVLSHWATPLNTIIATNVVGVKSLFPF